MNQIEMYVIHQLQNHAIKIELLVHFTRDDDFCCCCYFGIVCVIFFFIRSYWWQIIFSILFFSFISKKCCEYVERLRVQIRCSLYNSYLIKFSVYIFLFFSILLPTRKPDFLSFSFCVFSKIWSLSFFFFLFFRTRKKQRERWFFFLLVFSFLFFLYFNLDR